MMYEQYRNFVFNKQVLHAMEEALGAKRQCLVENSTSNSMTINVGPLYSSKFESVKRKREDVGCNIDYCYQNTAYYLKYNDNARQELLREIKELFPHSRIIRFKHDDESGARLPVNIPYNDWFDFAEKSGNPFKEHSAEDVKEYLEQVEAKIEKSLQEHFGVEYTPIKYTYGCVEMSIYFSGLYLPQNNIHLLDQYDVYSDSGYSETLLYTDKNKQLVREQLQSLFPGLEVYDFSTNGVASSADGISPKFVLRADCICPLENIL